MANEILSLPASVARLEEVQQMQSKLDSQRERAKRLTREIGSLPGAVGVRTTVAGVAGAALAGAVDARTTPMGGQPNSIWIALVLGTAGAMTGNAELLGLANGFALPHVYQRSFIAMTPK